MRKAKQKKENETTLSSVVAVFDKRFKSAKTKNVTSFVRSGEAKAALKVRKTEHETSWKS